MLYITGIYALNLPCWSLETSGDWHQSALDWSRPQVVDTENMFFGDYGLEAGHPIPEHEDAFYVANTIRACLDLLEFGLFSVAQGMNEDFIGNSIYDDTVFEKVSTMKVLSNWEQIDHFMRKEYRCAWLGYKEKNNV